MFVVSLGKKNDEPLKSNIIEVDDVSSSSVKGLSKDPINENPVNDLTKQMEQAKIIAETEIRKYRLNIEIEARKKEEAYRQQARLLRSKQQQRVGTAYSTPAGMKTLPVLLLMILQMFYVPAF